MALQQAREYALDALSKAHAQVKDALKQAGGPSAPHATSNDPPSVTAGLVSSLTTALSEARSSLMSRQSTGSDSGTALSAVLEHENVRLQRFKQELAGSCINIHALKRLAFHGIPDKDNLRGLIWKVGMSLSYSEIVPDTSFWPHTAAAGLLASEPRALEPVSGKAPHTVPCFLRRESCYALAEHLAHIPALLNQPPSTSPVNI